VKWSLALLLACATAQADEAGDRIDQLAGILHESLELDSLMARLQREQFESSNARGQLDAHHESVVTRWNIAAILVGAAITIVGSAMQFGNQTVAEGGDGVLIAGAVSTGAFSIVALTKRDAGRLPVAIETNFLAPFFDRASTPDSTWPADVWRLIDAPAPGAASSIRVELVEKWRREHRVAPKRLDLLTTPLTTARRIDAAVLGDRAEMLADVRSRIAHLSIGLDTRFHQLREPP
jgi:hypothetical protein